MLINKMDLLIGSRIFGMQHLYRFLEYLVQRGADILVHLNCQMQDAYVRKHTVISQTRKDLTVDGATLPLVGRHESQLKQQ